MRYLGLLLICFCCFPAFGQQLPDNKSAKPGSAESYFEKAKKQKTAAWVLLGGGTVISSIGLGKAISHVNYFGSQTEEDKRKQRTGEALFYVGSAAVLSSIPLYIASARNKRAAKLLVKNESAFLPDSRGHRSFTALSVVFAL